VSPWALAVLAVALAIDAFSVAAATAPSCSRRWGPLRLAGAFGLFQALMPVLGALASAHLLKYVKDYDHWVAFGLLEIIGIKMLLDALWLNRRGGGEEDGGAPAAARGDPSWGWSLLGLSIATSIDAFGAGVAIQVQTAGSTRGAGLATCAAAIGLTCAVLTYLGARLGHAAERWFGAKAEIAGGLVLMALGVKMLFTV